MPNLTDRQILAREGLRFRVLEKEYHIAAPVIRDRNRWRAELLRLLEDHGCVRGNVVDPSLMTPSQSVLFRESFIDWLANHCDELKRDEERDGVLSYLDDIELGELAAKVLEWVQRPFAAQPQQPTTST